MENLPKIGFNKVEEEMKKEGFYFWKIESLYETRGVSSKNNNDEGFIFKTEKVQTEQDIVNEVKNDPQFSEVKDNLEIRLIKTNERYDAYYVFVKILE